MAPDSKAPDLTIAGVSTRQEKTTLRQNRKTVFICALISLVCMQYGLDLSIINSAQAMPGFLKVFGYPDASEATGYSIKTWFQTSITSMMNVGIILGSFALEPCATWLGRRYAFLIGSVACFIANTILIASKNKGSIIFGRLVFGFSNGIFTGMATIYISEAAPSHLRGSLISCMQLTVCIGTVIGNVVVNATQGMANTLSYQIPLFILYVVPGFVVGLVFFIPESPRWLVLKDREDEARIHLARLRGDGFPAEIVDAELLAIKAAVAAEQEQAISKWEALQAMFTERERTRTLLTFAATTFHAASGFPFLAGYSTYFFQIAGSADAFIDSIIVTTISVLGALGGVFMNRSVGRRPMMLFAFSSQAVLMLVIGVVWATIPDTPTAGKIIVAMCVVYQTDYSAFCGPTAFVCAGEIPNTRLRAVTYGVGSAIGFLGNFLISLSTPYFINPSALNIGANIGFIWFASNLITFVFVYLYLPETHRRSLEDIDEMFYAKVPLRKFKQYQCSGIVSPGDAPSEKKPEVQQLEHKE
ncbi:general substrate transporter [Xylariomycetidae sp. FL0641]|nr:general substrate transporter [Xylariomycetidae sp. FL0641]